MCIFFFIFIFEELLDIEPEGRRHCYISAWVFSSCFISGCLVLHSILPSETLCSLYEWDLYLGLCCLELKGIV